MLDDLAYSSASVGWHVMLLGLAVVGGVGANRIDFFYCLILCRFVLALRLEFRASGFGDCTFFKKSCTHVHVGPSLLLVLLLRRRQPPPPRATATTTTTAFHRYFHKRTAAQLNLPEHATGSEGHRLIRGIFVQHLRDERDRAMGVALGFRAKG